MFFDEVSLSFFQVPKFWKSLRQKFFEIDLKNILKKIWNFLRSKIFEKVGFQLKFFENRKNRKFSKISIFRKFSIEIHIFRNFPISSIFRKFSNFFKIDLKKFYRSDFQNFGTWKIWDSPRQKTFRVRPAHTYSKHPKIEKRDQCKKNATFRQQM